MKEFPNIIHYAIPFFILTMFLEFLISIKINHKTYAQKDFITSIAMGLGNVAVDLISKILVFGIFFYFYNHFRIFTIPVTWWSFILLFFLEDFSYYWFHRKSHEIRFLWASHVVHHSSTHYNLSTALRQTWTGGFFSFIFWIWLPLLGFEPNMIIFQMSISLLYQYWIHTELIDKMPHWFEWIMNTPSHHRVHHGSNPIYLDRNHAGILIIWDRIFGTFQAELPQEKVKYGLVTNIDTHNPIKVAFLEWISMFQDVFSNRIPFLKRIGYFIHAPGWKHDGSGMEASDLRQAWLKNGKQTRI